MSLVVTLPTKFLPVSSVECAWWAVHNPIIALMQRKDHLITSLADDGGLQQIVITGAAISPAPAVGDVLYIDTIDFNNPLKGLFIISAYSYSGGDNLITITEPYDALRIVNMGGFLNNLTAKENYYIEVKYEKYSFGSGTWEAFGNNTFHVPPVTGLAEVDLSAMMKAAVSMKDEIAWGTGIINFADDNLSAAMRIFVREMWTPPIGGDPAFTSIETPIGIIDAAMQVQRFDGNNLANQMLEHTGQDFAKFVTDFKVPRLWETLPFDLGFIYSADIADNNNPATGSTVFYRVIDRASDNDNIDEDVIDDTQAYLMNRLNLSRITFGTNRIKVYLASKFAP